MSSALVDLDPDLGYGVVVLSEAVAAESQLLQLTEVGESAAMDVSESSVSDAEEDQLVESGQDVLADARQVTTSVQLQVSQRLERRQRLRFYSLDGILRQIEPDQFLQIAEHSDGNPAETVSTEIQRRQSGEGGVQLEPVFHLRDEVVRQVDGFQVTHRVTRLVRGGGRRQETAVGFSHTRQQIATQRQNLSKNQRTKESV